MKRLHPSRLAFGGLATIMLAMSGCGIQADSAPRDVPADEQIIAEGSSGTDAAGAERIYLVAPGENQLLRSVPRDATSRSDLMRILFLGPNDEESAAQFSSTIPSTTELLSARSQGTVLFVDVSAGLTELTGDGLTRALAQIVYTASEIDGVEAVQLTVDGDLISWPKGNLDASSNPLRTYDYPGYVQTAQPAYPAVPSGA